MYFLCHFTVNLIGFNTRLIDSMCDRETEFAFREIFAENLFS